MRSFLLAHILAAASVLFALIALATVWLYRPGVPVAWGLLALFAAMLCRAECRRVRRSRADLRVLARLWPAGDHPRNVRVMYMPDHEL